MTVNKKRKVADKKKKVPFSIVHIHATFNNIIITFATKTGDVIAWSSAGSNGFRGSRKSMPYAAQITAQAAAEKAKLHGVKVVEVIVQGPGAGRESAIRELVNYVDIQSLQDVTPIPHNGCKPPKRRRV